MVYNSTYPPESGLSLAVCAREATVLSRILVVELKEYKTEQYLPKSGVLSIDGARRARFCSSSTAHVFPKNAPSILNHPEYLPASFRLAREGTAANEEVYPGKAPPHLLSRRARIAEKYG